MTAASARHDAFRKLLRGPQLTMMMEAHSALSARVAEGAGFTCLWGSGLTISSSLGLRDSNEASWTQVLEVLEFMSDAVGIPILFDGDTGFGNFNNFRRLVGKLCRRSISGVVIEDKVFPKMNSFVGDRHPLAEVDEVCGKIRAGKDSQPDDGFSIIARTEALIANRGVDEAFRRAEAYHAAGADGIFIHSRASDAGEILEFGRRWDGRCPLVVAPTTYYGTDPEQLRAVGVTLLICANHSLRASMRAMEEICRRILADGGLHAAEGAVSSLKDLFSLLDYQELAEAERRYLPATDGAAALPASTSTGALP